VQNIFTNLKLIFSQDMVHENNIFVSYHLLYDICMIKIIKFSTRTMKQKIFRFIFVLSLITFNGQNFFSQTFYRIKTDVTIKKKNFDGTFSLTKGTVYYDRHQNMLIYDLWFPEKEKLIMDKAMTYHIRGGKLIQTFQNPTPPEVSIFSLILKNSIQYYGLENSDYQLKDIEEDNGLIISTWMPPEHLKSAVGKLMIANQNGKIKGIIFYSTDGEKIISKQFFENYIKVNGLDIPTKMVQFFYDKTGKESLQTTEFKNIVIDEKANDHLYRFPLEKYINN